LPEPPHAPNDEGPHSAARIPRGIPRGPREDDLGPEWVGARRALAERAAGRPLPHLGGAAVPDADARGNVENLVGWARVPIGLAGPLHLEGPDGGERTVPVPMATTEGALVASASRGMALCAAAGPIRARVVGDRLSQAPILVYGSVDDALRAAAEVTASLERFRGIVAGITRHGALESAAAEVVGRRLVLRLWFTTGDAIGINMASHGAELCSRDLAERTGALERYVHGEDVEKRANARALAEGRGRSVVAEAVVPRSVLEARARATPGAMASLQRSYRTGFTRLGTQNWTIQSANVLAAIFIACGQDVAYVTECATGQLDLEVDADGDLHAAVTLPSLLVGTVGGGSGQGTAAECLDVLGCLGAGRARAFAEVVGAAVLAADVSLAAAFVSHEFVDAHEALGRNRPGAG